MHRSVKNQSWYNNNQDTNHSITRGFNPYDRPIRYSPLGWRIVPVLLGSWIVLGIAMVVFWATNQFGGL